MGNEVVVCSHGAYQKPLTCQICLDQSRERLLEGQIERFYGKPPDYQPAQPIVPTKISNKIVTPPQLPENYCSKHNIKYIWQCHDCYTSSAAKNDQEKPDLSLIPKEALEAAARAFMVGQKKYGRYNYYKGHKASQLIAALIRHATAWMDGEDNDPQDGQPHLGSVIACAAMLLKQMALGTLIDDRHKPDSK